MAVTKRLVIDALLAILCLVIISVSVLGLVWFTVEDIEDSNSEDESVPPPVPIGCDPDLAPIQSLCDSEISTYKLIETIPYGDINQTLISQYQPTAEAYIELITQAQQTLYIACSYFTLNDSQYQIP
jgi:phosphatidylserine/phosphatidylglycerophosphate/cardiolipin synthase-like enzyme